MWLARLPSPHPLLPLLQQPAAVVLEWKQSQEGPGHGAVLVGVAVKKHAFPVAVSPAAADVAGENVETGLRRLGAAAYAASFGDAVRRLGG